jgi:glycosyltransferase involved in cell wall biosynthesis
MIKKGKYKKIIMLGTSPEAHGGIAALVGNYRDCGVLKKWKVKYVVTHVQGSRFAKARAAAVAILQLLYMLVTGQIGLLHVHMSSRASTWRKSFFLLTAMAFRAPYLIHLHSPDFVNFFEHECGERGKKLIRFLLSRALYVIALSPGWAKDIRKICPATRTVILFNSVPLPATALREKEIDESSSDLCDPPLILFLGHVGKRKGTFDLIQAVALLSENFRLVIGGDGELQRAQMLSEELGVSDKILLAGWLGKAERDHLLARAAIFVLPSYQEGMPMAILEAMSWAVPIVTTPVGGIPEVVTEGQEGLLVDSGDIVGLAHALARLLAAPSFRQKLGERGRRKIESKFSIKLLQPQLEQVWINSGVPESEPVAQRGGSHAG